MSSIANPITSTDASANQTNSPLGPARVDPLADESTFLKLLVSQLQNQDPLSPVDSNQFVTQLTQYSQLEQLIGIHADTTTLDSTVAPATTNGPTTTIPGTSQTTGAQ
jgi:flagellar basal-body rod modification protein FlgD